MSVHLFPCEFVWRTSVVGVCKEQQKIFFRKFLPKKYLLDISPDKLEVKLNLKKPKQ